MKGPNFTAFIVIDDGICVRGSSILRGFIGAQEWQIREHIKARKWVIVDINLGVQLDLFSDSGKEG